MRISDWSSDVCSSDLGSIALLAFIFGDYATQILSLGPLSSAIYGALVILVITTLNWIGVHFGARAQNSLTIIEVLGLLLVRPAVLLLAPATPSAIAATDGKSSVWGKRGDVRVHL